MTTIRSLLALVVLGTVTIACGSSAASSPAAATTATVASTAATIASTAATIAATTTTVTPTTTIPATTTTVVAFSRESRLAVGRCKDSMGFAFGARITLDNEYLTTAQAACKEAGTQIDADNPGPGSPGRNMAYQVALVNMAMAISAYEIVTDAYDVAAQQRLTAAVTTFDKGVLTYLR